MRAWAKITPSMDDAARSLGHRARPQTLRRVHLPLLRGSLLTAGLLVFIDVMKELPATLVMRPFNFDTLATQAYTLASDERLAEASTAALAIVVVGLLPLIVQRQPARSKAFWALAALRARSPTGSASGLNVPSAFRAGLSILTELTAGHSLLPSAK
jgi:ABC-type Fe3+ transport system permease subunit